jgi:hypothetical protein
VRIGGHSVLLLKALAEKRQASVEIGEALADKRANEA